MLGLILDTFILVFLVKAIAEHEDDDFIKPAVIAILASITLFAASFAIASVEVGGLYILIGAILAVGVMVAAGCFILIGTDPKNSAIIAGAFVIYKIAISFLFAFLFAGP